MLKFKPSMDTTHPLEISENRPDSRYFFASTPAEMAGHALQKARETYTERLGRVERFRTHAFMHEDHDALVHAEVLAARIEGRFARRIADIAIVEAFATEAVQSDPSEI